MELPETDWANKTEKEKEMYYLSCSLCGGEKDSEGWCANYCTSPLPDLFADVSPVE